MSVVTQLSSISNEELRKRIINLVNIEEWADECSKCGYPRLLHLDEKHRDASCTQEAEVPDILNKNWSEFRKQVKPIVKAWKETLRKEHEEGVLLKGLERLDTKISGQNTDNMNKYTENMNTLVSSFKESIVKDGGTNTSDYSASGTRVTKLTKPI